MDKDESPTSRPKPSLTDIWEAELQALDEQLRARGRTVIVAPVDSNEFVACIPQGRPPGSPSASHRTG
jgi:hypothetical protein